MSNMLACKSERDGRDNLRLTQNNKPALACCQIKHKYAPGAGKSEPQAQFGRI